MTHTGANQTKICINFAHSWIEQEFLFQNEGSLPTHFAFFSSFLRCKKQVFEAELNPPSTLAGSLFALPHEVRISEEWDTALGTVWYLPGDCVPLRGVDANCLGWHQMEKRQDTCWPGTICLLPLSLQVCSFHFLCASLFFFGKAISLTYISFAAPHKQPPRAAAPARFILSDLCHWMPFPLCCDTSLPHQSGIHTSSFSFYKKSVLFNQETEGLYNGNSLFLSCSTLP